MSRFRLYLDEDSMRRALVFGLRSRNVDVVTASEREMINRPDADHLTTAAQEGRVLFSFNLADYCQLHRRWMESGQPHAGIIVARQQHLSVGEEIRQLLWLRNRLSAEEMVNRLEFLKAWTLTVAPPGS